eukprot:1253106-Amorphochlora_amoeboformis.AAC.2
MIYTQQQQHGMKRKRGEDEKIPTKGHVNYHRPRGKSKGIVRQILLPNMNTQGNVKVSPNVNMAASVLQTLNSWKRGGSGFQCYRIRCFKTYTVVLVWAR